MKYIDKTRKPVETLHVTSLDVVYETANCCNFLDGSPISSGVATPVSLNLLEFLLASKATPCTKP
ncbi:hypothetical protein [Nostoc sp. DedQUE09]|uniref:hypothetical protein n=1 Tax=Nostoc sp. DedQUE09 TaxID=3075394 RepID=UPI002AD3DF8F|nr:hypothetical protein [Nostoc sp. DedQUE09]MDZ7952545.1 hypothetical protein [Nostoc sp. DedQUE09]